MWKQIRSNRVGGRAQFFICLSLIFALTGGCGCSEMEDSDEMQYLDSSKSLDMISGTAKNAAKNNWSTALRSLPTDSSRHAPISIHSFKGEPSNLLTLTEEPEPEREPEANLGRFARFKNAARRLLRRARAGLLSAKDRVMDLLSRGYICRKLRGRFICKRGQSTVDMPDRNRFEMQDFANLAEDPDQPSEPLETPPPKPERLNLYNRNDSGELVTGDE